MPELVLAATVVILDNLGSILLAGLADVEDLAAESVDHVFLLASLLLFKSKPLVGLVGFVSSIDTGSVGSVLHSKVFSISLALDIEFILTARNKGE